MSGKLKSGRPAEPAWDRQLKVHFVMAWAGLIKRRALDRGVSFKELDAQLGSPHGHEKSPGRSWRKYVRGEKIPRNTDKLLQISKEAYGLGYLGFIESLMVWETQAEIEDRRRHEWASEEALYEVCKREEALWALQRADELESKARELLELAACIRRYHTQVGKAGTATFLPQ